MARKGWSNLTSYYRSRLERKGITQSSYESGTPLKAARGHEHTPERPERYVPSEPRYSAYVDVRREIQNIKQQMFGTVGKSSYKELRGISRGDLIRGKNALQYMRSNNMSLAEFRAENPEFEGTEWDWLGHYH